MIGSIDIQVNASHPNLALQTVYQFRNSPSQIRVLNVPKKIGQSDISSVYVAVNYPDGHNKSFETTKVANAYVTEIDASDTSGKTANGFTILGNGTDRSGLPISNYVLGKGDFYVLQDDMQITIGEDSYFLRLVDSMPQTPKKGDTLIVDGKLKIYNGTEWVEISGSGESYWTKTDKQLSLKGDISAVYISAYTVIDNLSSDSIPTKTSDLQNDSGFLTQHQSLTAYATKTHVSQNYVQKVSGSENNIVLFDSLGKIKDSSTELTSLASKTDLNYSYSSQRVTHVDSCVIAYSGIFKNITYVEPCITAFVYLQDVGCQNVADTMIQFDYTSLTADSQLPQINWHIGTCETATINWQSIEGDTVEHGNEYMYMVQTYQTGPDGYGGIMTIRKLNSAVCDE